MAEGFRWHEWNEDHIGSHGIAPDEAEHVVIHAERPYPEQIGDDKWRVRGQTAAERYIQVIFVFDPEGTVFVIPARGLSDQEKRQWRRRTR